jgi:hypothetical protein
MNSILEVIWSYNSGFFVVHITGYNWLETLDCKQIIGNAIVSSGVGGSLGFYKDRKILVITIKMPFCTYLYPNSKNKIFVVLSQKTIKRPI